jgi:segregation and condensation protein B
MTESSSAEYSGRANETRHEMPFPEMQDRVLSQTVLDDRSSAIDDRDDDLVALVEALLLASLGPTTIHELAAGADVSPTAIREALSVLESQEERGWVVQRHGSDVQLSTAPRFAEQVRRFLGIEREARLSAPALETLAIVAYQQPVTRSALEAVRGVDCSAVLSTIISRGLVEVDTRSDLPGQPYLYRTSPAFLQHFGLSSLDELPALTRPDGSSLVEMLNATVQEADEHQTPLVLNEAMPHQDSGASELTNS